MNWSKISTISVWTGGIIAIVYAFSKKYIHHPLVFIVVGVLAFSIFLFSELMVLIAKLRLKKKHDDE
jgi:hypothetical protein